MELKDVVSIGGIGGLHKIIGQRPTGLIVESLDKDKKRFPTNLSQKISVLEDIAIYTVEGEERLGKVLLAIHELENGGATVPGKKDDEAAIRSFTEKALPNYDKERVYISDLRKLYQWYHILKSELDWSSLSDDKVEDAGEEKKDAKKAAPKKTATKAAGAKKTVAPKSANVKSKTNTPRKTGGA
ncbi:MAG: hypothetical protein EP332_11085 [Bacteroidetes bacterium]|nr:MAG: hypothetical protein EP332_11085 [Bacteroidota bacterium]